MPQSGANGGGNFRTVGRQSAEVKLHFVSSFVPEPTRPFHDDNRLQSGPLVGLMEGGKRFDWEGSDGAAINAMMSSFSGGVAEKRSSDVYYLYPRSPSNRRKCTCPDASPATIVTPSGVIAQHCNRESPLKLAITLPVFRFQKLRVAS